MRIKILWETINHVNASLEMIKTNLLLPLIDN